jgi:5-formyltetrahydrofolate cyclo-ligase
VANDKAERRVHIRAARDAFFAQPHHSIVVPDMFRKRLSHGLTVTSYVPLGSEADPSPLARAAVEAGCVLALPHVTRRRADPLRFLAWETEAALVGGPLGLQQPAETATALHPDIILTPLLAFDRAFNRLGQGAGYYDRAFVEFPDAWRIGIAWSVQEVDALPTDAWDVPLHAIATEKEWLTP